MIFVQCIEKRRNFTVGKIYGITIRDTIHGCTYYDIVNDKKMSDIVISTDFAEQDVKDFNGSPSEFPLEIVSE